MARGGKKNNNGGKKKNRMGGRKIKGRGDYQTFNLRGMASKLDQALSRIPKGTFARKGAQMGAKYGALGALAGKGLGAGLAAVTGYGNYSVRANSLSKVSTSVDMIPQFVKNDHSIRVTHREFIKDLVVPNDPATFSLQSFLINPANKTLFPWLATMAKQYSQYKIHGMVFAYKTMSSDITAGGALGTVIMATNYNAIDRSFVNKIEMENSEFAVSTKPSMSLVHAIECDPKYSGLDVLYVRDPSYETLDTNDRRFYDYGRFQVATTGLPGDTATVMGELWVSYDIEFMKPVLGGSDLPTYIPGTTMVSKSDGTTGVGTTTQGIRKIIYQAAAFQPAVSTSQSLMPAAGTASGDTGLNGVVVSSITSTGFKLLKNGRYRVTLYGHGATTLTNPHWPATTALAPINLTTVPTGVAAASVVPALGSTNNVMSNAGVFAASSVGYTYSVSWDIVVTGIVGAGDTVELQPTTFTSNSTALISSVVRSLMVDWYQLGINAQDPTFIA